MLHPLNRRAGLLAQELQVADVMRWKHHYEKRLRVEFDVFDVAREHRPQKGVCNVLRELDFISADGEVLLCALDHRAEYRFGNLADISLEAAREARLAAYRNGETLVRCLQCEFFPGRSYAGERPASSATRESGDGSGSSADR